MPQAAQLKAAGVDQVVCVTVAEPGQVQQWAAAHGFTQQPTVRGMAACTGGGHEAADDSTTWFTFFECM